MNLKHNFIDALSAITLGANTYRAVSSVFTIMADEEEKKEVIRRAPCIETKISDLSEGGRVAVAGTVITKNSEISSFVIDDGEDKVQVLTNNPRDFEKINEGQFIRVLGKVWGGGDEVEIQADVVQDFDKVDKELYKKVLLASE
ncbi:hypothetical protein GF374_02280 [Candidatus Woesearchaeota archaeon]|nr:hypothetical protein [Candidatus Woesearchaeota archaeon]